MRHFTGPGGRYHAALDAGGGAAGSPAGAGNDASPGDAAAAAVVRGFLAAVDMGDLETLAGLFDPDASGYLPFADTPVLLDGREAVLARFTRLVDAWRARGKSPPYVGFEPRELLVRPAGPGHALATFLVGIEGDTGRRSLLLRHTPAGWRILHLHASNLAPRAG